MYAMRAKKTNKRSRAAYSLGVRDVIDAVVVASGHQLSLQVADTHLVHVILRRAHPHLQNSIADNYHVGGVA